MLPIVSILQGIKHFHLMNGPCINARSPVYLTSLWWFTWAGGGGTKEPVMTQGVPDAGREVGLMYSFSSQSEDDFSPLDTAGRDLITNTKHKP